jgi:plastocyanin
MPVGAPTSGGFLWYTFSRIEHSKEDAMKYTSLFILVLVLLLPLGPGAYGEEAVKEKRVVATVDADGVQRVEVVGGGYYFDPNYIVVKVNVPVELNVRKEAGYTPHDIAVKAPEAGIDFAESLGKDPKTITFTPKTIGKYEMYCSKKLIFVKSHKDRGMVGTIEVVQ